MVGGWIWCTCRDKDGRCLVRDGILARGKQQADGERTERRRCELTESLLVELTPTIGRPAPAPNLLNHIVRDLRRPNFGCCVRWGGSGFCW